MEHEKRTVFLTHPIVLYIMREQREAVNIYSEKRVVVQKKTADDSEKERAGNEK